MWITSGKLLAYAVLGAFFGSLGAYLMVSPPIEEIMAGLCGYDGSLVGCSCWAFLTIQNGHENTWLLVITAIVLSFVSGILHVSCSNILKTFGLPTFTFAFNITMMCFLLALKTNNSEIILLKGPSSKTYSDDYTDVTIMFIVDSFFKGVGQFMFIDTTVGGGLVVAGVAVASRFGALAAFLGAAMGSLTSTFLLRVPDQQLVNVRDGLNGYNSSGCNAALSGGLFYKPTLSGFIYGMAGGCIATLLLLAFKSIFGYL